MQRCQHLLALHADPTRLNLQMQGEYHHQRSYSFDVSRSASAAANASQPSPLRSASPLGKPQTASSSACATAHDPQQAMYSPLQQQYLASLSAGQLPPGILQGVPGMLPAQSGQQSNLPMSLPLPSRSSQGHGMVLPGDPNGRAHDGSQFGTGAGGNSQHRTPSAAELANSFATASARSSQPPPQQLQQHSPQSQQHSGGEHCTNLSTDDESLSSLDAKMTASVADLLRGSSGSLVAAAPPQQQQRQDMPQPRQQASGDWRSSWDGAQQSQQAQLQRDGSAPATAAMAVHSGIPLTNGAAAHHLAARDHIA